MNTINRDFYLNELAVRRENGLIKVITGIRRCGKSFLLFNLYYDYLLSEGVKEENIIKISLEDEDMEALRDCKNLSDYIRGRLKNNDDMHYIFIDEVQYAISREDLKSDKPLPLYGVLNGLLKLKNADVYVTGSNSKLLSKDVLTEFRGRGDEVRVYPLTFSEYFSFIGGDKADAFEEYSLYGGLPLILQKTGAREKTRYLTGLFNEVYFKDITERYNIALPEIMALLTDDLCSSVGSLTNSTKISKTLKSVKNIDVDDQTISAYLEYLEEAFLFSKAKRYDVKGKKYFFYPVKYYCTDMGLRNARLNFRQQEETHAMENIIYNELVARGYSVDVGVVPVKTVDADGKQHLNQYEIDFVVNDGMKKYYLQSALNISGEDKKKAELRPLLATKDFFRKVVILKSRVKPWFDEDGILYMGIYDFLLDKNLLD